MRRTVLVLMAALAPHADAVAAPRCGPEADSVRTVARGIVEADNARDIERVLSHYAEDAVLLPPGEGPVVGREAIRPRYEALFAGFDPEIEMDIEEACVEGDLGFVRGHNGGRLVARGSAGVRELDDAYLMLLQRGADGGWRISHLMWHRAGDQGWRPPRR